MSGRQPRQPVLNPGVRTTEQQRRHAQAAAGAAGGARTAAGAAGPQGGQYPFKGSSCVEAVAAVPGARAVTPKVAAAALRALPRRSRLRFVVAHIRSTGYTCLSSVEIPDVRVLDSCYVHAGPERRGLWVKYFTRAPQEEAASRLLTAALNTHGPLEVHSGPSDSLPCSDDALPEGVSLRPGFRVDFAADLKHAACSTEAEDFFKLTDLTFGDFGIQDRRGVTAVHLAALAGDIALAEAVVQRAAELNLPQAHWQDEGGRTPLHLAVLLNSGRLARAFVDLCGLDAKDRWGHTAADLASTLGHWDALGGLTSEPGSLRQVCLRRLRGLTPEAMAALAPSEAYLLAEQLPLHEYGMLSRLSAAHPGVVDPAHLARSMSCLECWYAHLCNAGCSTVLDGGHELIRVWNDLPSFGYTGAQDEAGVVLVRHPGKQSAPTVADRDTFLERFHRRTGGVLRDIDWSNLMVIGGMVLACLTADDEEYRRNYRETDVDIYVVGLRGQAFKDRVAELVESLPGHIKRDDFSIGVNDASKLTVRAEQGRLVFKGVEGKPKTVSGEDFGREVSLRPGDVIVEVEGSTDLSEMTWLLKQPCYEEWSAPKRPRPHFITARRPQDADRAALHSTVLRTPQTLTACIWNSKLRQKVPNVQVVLAPYESPAHLLYTTDIDCTAMGFDGMHLVAAPRAREAIRRRRNVARPEKYMVRGEWRTEARLMKYAMRGFQVVDLGLKSASQVRSRKLEGAAARAEGLLQMPRPQGESEPDRRAAIEACVKEVAGRGVYGAGLLLEASGLKGLRWLMLHETPLLPAGLQWPDARKLVRSIVPSRWRRGDDDGGDAEPAAPNSTFDFDDGYGRVKARLSIVNPASRSGSRIMDGGLRGLESSLESAIVELDVESDRFEVRGWYDGVPASALHAEHSSLDPLVWRGLGDFRPAA